MSFVLELRFQSSLHVSALESPLQMISVIPTLGTVSHLTDLFCAYGMFLLVQNINDGDVIIVTNPIVL